MSGNWWFILLLALPLQAQQGGFISGVIHDRSGGVVAGAEVRVQSEQTGARQKITADSAGLYSTSELSPGLYQVTVRNDGFRTSNRDEIRVAAAQHVSLDVTLDLLPVQQEVTVIASENENDPMVSGVTVSRDTPAASLPSNGHDVHALFDLMPGATVTPASLTSGGQFTVGGQRPNENSFRVDGVSGNVGIGIISVPGSFPGGSLPGMTTIGGMQSLASNEETQRVELLSADFTAQYGDRPGAQIDIETRAGTNEFHGSAFGYIRPQSFNSSDWFARGAAQDLAPARLNGWGGSVGGPIWRNHTFFFTSFERTDVHDSALQLIPVASYAARAAAGAPYQALLNSFPQPLGRPLSATESVGYSPLQKAASVTNESIRLDRSFGKHLQFFGRYANVPSSSTSIELGTAYSSFSWESATAGLTLLTGNVTQEGRFNYSKATSLAQHGPSDTPALTTLRDSLLTSLFPGTLLDRFFNLANVTQVSIAGVGQTVSGTQGTSNEIQLEGSYSIAIHAGRHAIQAGGDSIQLEPTLNLFEASLAIASPSIDALLAGIPLGFTNSVYLGDQSSTQRWSYFGQDTWHIRPNLDVLFGIRWEMTPKPFSFPNDEPPDYYQSLGFWHGIGSAPPTTVATDIRPQVSNFPLRYSQIAPRLGLAYHLGHPDLVLRAGAGIFYDAAVGSIVSNEDPLSVWQYVPPSATPAIENNPQPNVPDPVLYLPRVVEWRTSIEKSLHESSLLSLSYFGSSGERLLRNEATIDPQTSVLQTFAFTSHGKSSYQALLTQFRGNLTPNLFALLSYTWAHSIDNGSSDTALELVQPGVTSLNDRGASSFDIRHLFTASIGYKVPYSTLTPRLRHYLAGWSISSTLIARTGFPFDVTTIDRSVGFGFDNSGRANLVTGVPIWIYNSSAPGGRELNPAAFLTPANGENGTLGRNAITGFGLFQIDTSVRRQFRLYGSLSMETSISAFNLLNHPSFANPVNYLGSALFGQSTSQANLMLGSGSPTTGLTPLFQSGGPRTIEFGLRFSF